MRLLHIDSSILGDTSASRAISAAIVERLRGADPAVEIVYRDLAADPIPHMTFNAFLQLDGAGEVQEFLDADIVVIGAGFYNFTIPSQLKAWLDRIVVRGRTFAYSEAGPVGLTAGKRVIVALARGGVYGSGSPRAAFEHAETLLRNVFDLLGATTEFIVAEGLALGEEARSAAIDHALEQTRSLSQN